MVDLDTRRNHLCLSFFASERDSSLSLYISALDYEPAFRDYTYEKTDIANFSKFLSGTMKLFSIFAVLATVTAMAVNTDPL